MQHLFATLASVAYQLKKKEKLPWPLKSTGSSRKSEECEDVVLRGASRKVTGGVGQGSVLRAVSFHASINKHK